LARFCGLIRGEWIAVDGTRFRAVSSANSVRERQAVSRYLDSCEKADEEQQAMIDPSAVQAAIKKLKQHPEPEVGRMRMAGGFAPAYNVQTAVDAEHALIRHAQVSHLRTSTPAAARHTRRSDRNRTRRHVLQPQAHGQPARRIIAHPETVLRLSVTSQPQRPKALPRGSAFLVLTA
jgi:hypothetical protein